jgi:formylglycine-generating enzyme required for sulfatase activity
VFRGGAWDSGGTSCRAALRGFLGPGNSYYDIGFRVAPSDPTGDK